LVEIGGMAWKCTKNKHIYKQTDTLYKPAVYIKLICIIYNN
jgi:hypothetical protein